MHDLFVRLLKAHVVNFVDAESNKCFFPCTAKNPAHTYRSTLSYVLGENNCFLDTVMTMPQMKEQGDKELNLNDVNLGKLFSLE